MSIYSYRPILTNKYFEGEPLRLGHDTQLLAADTVVEDAYRVYRVQEQGVKYSSEPVVKVDKPWETFIQSPFILFDEEDGLYKMWYSTRHKVPGYEPEWETNLAIGHSDKVVCYAESKDGFNWVKPDLDIYEFGEWKKNNIVYADCDCGNTTSYVYFNPVKENKDEKFLMIWNGRGVHISTSPDGKHWTLKSDVTNVPMDCSFFLMFDTDRKMWQFLCRPSIFAKDEKMGSEKDICPNLNYRRRISIMESKDLVTWTTPRTVYTADENKVFTQADNLTFFTVGEHPMGFVHLFPARTMDECLTQYMVPFAFFGEDIYHMELLPDAKPMVDRGPEGSFDENYINIHGIPLDLKKDNRLYFFYCGDARNTSSQLGIVSFGKDRYVGRVGDRWGGWLLTKEILWEGSKLEINADVFPGGEIKVEILDNEHGMVRGGRIIKGHSIEECDPVLKDGYNTTITWNGDSDLSFLNGRAVFIRFSIKDAKLYTFTIKE